MQQNRPVKFNFDTVFGAPANGARARSTYAAEEVETIRRQSFAEGKADIEAQTAAAHAAALGAVAQGAMRLIGEHDAAIAALRQDSAAVALAVGRKLAEAALDAFPLKEVEALVVECLHKLHREPRLVVRVSEVCAENLRADIDALSAAHGYAGRVAILAEPSLERSDCRIEWADGGVERDLAKTFAIIEQSAERWRANPPVES
jgi:flagellar assembly protein FliH